MKQPIRLLVLAALAATVAGTAIAADTTGATTEDTKGHGVYSGEILVTASRTQELLKTEPQSAEVIFSVWVLMMYCPHWLWQIT